MKFALFCHSLISCWNNGHAHFLRGVVRELVQQQHEVVVCEPARGWSRSNALANGGEAYLAEAARLVPGITLHAYADNDYASEAVLDHVLDGADVVLVHEWNAPSLVAKLGRRRRSSHVRLLFLDAHHRAITAADEIAAFELENYDAVLAFGEVLREVYERRGWGRRAFTWHEAADIALFHPLEGMQSDCDLIWVGNWGDEERSAELREFLIEPAARLRLRTRIHGVRYPDKALTLLREAGITYAGWLPNHRVPSAFARAEVTVHVPRRAYASVLSGIPTIRVFEALACGIPLICSPWSDEEGLFPSGAYLQASDGASMTAALRAVLADREMAATLSRQGLSAIRQCHTCRHRVEELLTIVSSMEGRVRSTMPPARRPMMERMQ